ncbi:MAG: hypothetical protein JWQ71_1679 [Pedosphaera sp.]|nr:hypothetical protein [Pedosphaera sp.]
MKKILTVLTTLVCLALSATAAILPAEKVLPDDTLFMFTIPDFMKAKDIYSNSPQGQLWSDPSLKAFKDKFLGKLKSEYLTPMERDLGIHFEDYTGLLKGQFTFAVTQNGWDGKDKTQEPALLLLIDTKDKSSQLKTNLADLKKKWVDSGKSVKTEKIRDIEFSVAVLSSNDLPKSLRKSLSGGSAEAEKDKAEESDAKKPATKKQIYIGQAESMLIMGNSPKAIEKILARMSGGSVKSLSEVPIYEANHNAMFREAPLFGWINAKAFIDVLSREDASASDDSASNPFAFKPSKVMAAAGLNGLKTIAFNYLYSNDGAQFNLFLGAPETTRSGLFTILAGEPKEYIPPTFVPADAVKFQRWRIDGQKAWATLQKMLNDISPQTLNSLNFVLSTAEAGAKEKDSSFDIKKNLFGNLGNDIISYSKLPKGSSMADLDSAPSIFLVGSSNPDQLASALKNTFSFLLQQGGAPTEREFLGRKVYSLPLPGSATAKGEKAPARSMSFAGSGGYVVISTDTGMLEEYLRSNEKQGKSLREAPGLSEAMQKVAGSTTTSFGFSNDSESMRVTLEAFKKDFGSPESMGTLGPLAAIMGMSDPAKVKDWVDVSLLPTFDKVSKYFYFTVYSGSATSEGLSWKVFAPTPPQMKK